MDAVLNHRDEAKQQLIKKVGPWAFQSYSKDGWPNVSDRELISGALLKAKPEDRYLLLQVFDIDEIKRVWERYAVLEDKFFHASNVWAARNFFHASDPEKFVRQQYRKSRRLFMDGHLGI